MDAPSLEVLIAADAKQFPIAHVIKKMPSGKNYLCKTSRGTSSILDCKEKLKPGMVFFYQPIAVTSIRAIIGFKRLATSDETDAYNRFLDSTKAPFVDRAQYFDRAY